MNIFSHFKRNERPEGPPEQAATAAISFKGAEVKISPEQAATAAISFKGAEVKISQPYDPRWLNNSQLSGRYQAQDDRQTPDFSALPTETTLPHSDMLAGKSLGRIMEHSFKNGRSFNIKSGSDGSISIQLEGHSFELSLDRDPKGISRRSLSELLDVEDRICRDPLQKTSERSGREVHDLSRVHVPSSDMMAAGSLGQMFEHSLREGQTLVIEAGLNDSISIQLGGRSLGLSSIWDAKGISRPALMALLEFESKIYLDDAWKNVPRQSEVEFSAVRVSEDPMEKIDMNNAKQTRHFTGEEKAAILRRCLVDKVPVSDLCEEHGLQPTVFYRWLKEWFEQRALLFDTPKKA